MKTKKSVLMIGLQPELIDFSRPEYAAFPGLDAAKVMASLQADEDRLNGLGYDARMCLTDFGETAESVVKAVLEVRAFDVVMIGAGVRTISTNFLLFEKLVNVVHAHAPTSKICFNTKPSDTAEAVQRWL